jgi:hypothetical protein
LPDGFLHAVLHHPRRIRDTCPARVVGHAAPTWYLGHRVPGWDHRRHRDLPVLRCCLRDHGRLRPPLTLRPRSFADASGPVAKRATYDFMTPPCDYWLCPPRWDNHPAVAIFCRGCYGYRSEGRGFSGRTGIRRLKVRCQLATQSPEAFLAAARVRIRVR